MGEAPRQIAHQPIAEFGLDRRDPRAKSTPVDDENGKGQEDHGHHNVRVFMVHQVQTCGQNHDCRETDCSPCGQNGEYSGELRQDEANGPGDLRDANKGNESMLIGQSGYRGSELIKGEKLHGTCSAKNEGEQNLNNPKCNFHSGISRGYSLERTKKKGVRPFFD
jgi:hypothetical protein